MAFVFQMRKCTYAFLSLYLNLCFFSKSVFIMQKKYENIWVEKKQTIENKTFNRAFEIYLKNATLLKYK